MLRFIHCCALLTVLFLAQMGAVHHELGHVSIAQQQEIGAGVSDAACALCPAFAQVITPPFSHQLAAVLSLGPAVLSIDNTPDTLLDKAALEPRSRGPPTLS